MKLRLPTSPPDISARAVQRAWAAVATLTILVVIALVAGFLWISSENQRNQGRAEELTRKVERSDRERAELSKRVDDEHAAAQTLAEQVKRLGGKPVIEPTEGKPGQPGPAPTQAQVLAAVADYCTGGRCKPIVTRVQVKAAVADFCANDACKAVAKDGDDGTDGTDGTDGQPGAPGPAPTDDQLDAAVERYCAANECGKDGTDGTDGADGTSVTDVSCERGNGTFTFVFSDGSTRTVECSPVG